MGNILGAGLHAFQAKRNPPAMCGFINLLVLLPAWLRETEMLTGTWQAGYILAGESQILQGPGLGGPHSSLSPKTITSLKDFCKSFHLRTHHQLLPISDVLELQIGLCSQNSWNFFCTLNVAVLALRSMHSAAACETLWAGVNNF